LVWKIYYALSSPEADLDGGRREGAVEKGDLEGRRARSSGGRKGLRERGETD